MYPGNVPGQKHGCPRYKILYTGQVLLRTRTGYKFLYPGHVSAMWTKIPYDTNVPALGKKIVHNGIVSCPGNLGTEKLHIFHREKYALPPTEVSPFFRCWVFSKFLNSSFSKWRWGFSFELGLSSFPYKTKVILLWLARIQRFPKGLKVAKSMWEAWWLPHNCKILFLCVVNLRTVSQRLIGGSKMY